MKASVDPSPPELSHGSSASGAPSVRGGRAPGAGPTDEAASPPDASEVREGVAGAGDGSDVRPRAEAGKAREKSLAGEAAVPGLCPAEDAAAGVGTEGDAGGVAPASDCSNPFPGRVVDCCRRASPSDGGAGDAGELPAAGATRVGAADESATGAVESAAGGTASLASPGAGLSSPTSE
eukprot:scaffold2034_cov124-Isochrysis_galbana.AAC.2